MKLEVEVEYQCEEDMFLDSSLATSVTTSEF
jgi:hypothetical protein